MKRRNLSIMLALLCTAAIGCTVITGCSSKPAAPETTTVSSESPSDEATTAEAVNWPDEQEIRSLLTQNRKIQNYFFNGGIPVVGTDTAHEAFNAPIDVDNPDTYILQVSPEYFEDYAALESYVRSIYTEDYSDYLLYEHPSKDEPQFINVDGALYENVLKVGGKGYYVNWEDYSIELVECDGNNCSFRVITYEDVPAAEPITEPVIIEGSVAYENGHWLLTEVLF